MATSATAQGAKRQTKVRFPIDARTRSAVLSLAKSHCPALIIGETGTGKRALAEQIHFHSHELRNGFYEIRASDCTAERLLSALSSRGTIYLFDIAELSSALQEQIVKHYSQFKDAQGGRLLCGTSRELTDEIRSHRMREDFFHLISAVTLRIIPLRFRKAELLSITDDLLTQYSKQFDRPKPILSSEIIGFLLSHEWPGNLSELQTAVKTFVAIGDQPISLAALKAAAPAARLANLQRPLSLKQIARAASVKVERQLISQVLLATGGNRKRAADELGISYKALLYKLKQTETHTQSSSIENGVGL